MTLGAIREELAKLAHLHPLTETNVAEVQRHPLGVAFEFDTSQAEDERDEAREERDDAQSELKEIEAERQELADRLEALEASIEDAPAGNELRRVLEDSERFRKAATDWAQEVQRTREELTALRKRRGLMAGYYANARDVMAYLHDSKDPAAQALVTAIHANK